MNRSNVMRRLLGVKRRCSLAAIAITVPSLSEVRKYFVRVDVPKTGKNDRMQEHEMESSDDT